MRLSQKNRLSNGLLIIVFRLLSGYSRFPVHEPGNPLSFSGLLLVKKVKTRSSAIFATGPRIYTFVDSFSRMTRRNAGRCPNSSFRFCQRPGRRLTAFRLWTICAHAPCPLRNRLAARAKLAFSQTGRAHLLLISNTPGIAGGAIGVITLEGMPS